MRVRIPSVPLLIYEVLKNRLRLAPSPTGDFHIGTARTALFNWLYAKKTGGDFLIRIEDTDENRSKIEYTKNILDGLKWLGLDWDEEPINQSTRIDKHKKIIQNLLDQGKAYRCFTSEEEIKSLRDKQKKLHLPPKHDNRHRYLTKDEIDKFISEGKTSVIRFIIDDKSEIEWNDQIRGPIKWLGKDLGGDMVLSRRAKGYSIGSPLYNLAVVADDHYMKISHIIRGEDHISNTAKQILIFKALGFDLPKFSHAPLILNQEGKKLSKRDTVTSIHDFKKMGYLPDALANYMALLGWSVKSGSNEILSISEISQNFSLNDINKAGAKFSWDKLNWINSQYIKKMEIRNLFMIFRAYWKKNNWEEVSESWGLTLTKLLQESIIVLEDIVNQSKPFFVIPEIESSGIDFLRKNKLNEPMKDMLNLIKNNDKNFTNIIASEMIDLLSKKYNIKKGILMRGTRVAFFGCLSGPDLLITWELLSKRNEDYNRIQKCLNII